MLKAMSCLALCLIILTVEAERLSLSCVHTFTCQYSSTYILLTTVYICVHTEMYVLPYLLCSADEDRSR